MAKEDEIEEFDEDFRHIVRIAVTDLDGKKRIPLALTRIDGIGRRLAHVLTKLSEFDPDRRIGTLSEEESAQFDVLLERLPDHANDGRERSRTAGGGPRV